MIFSLKACKNARMMLLRSNEQGTRNVYEIVIGLDNNSRSYIHLWESEASRLHYTNTPNVLSCNISQEFWLSWENGLIGFGGGRIQWQATLMQYQDPTSPPPTVNSLSLATGSAVRGTWTIYRHAGIVF